MKRIALFAHYDRDGLIDDYVVYYLRGLRVAERICLCPTANCAPGKLPSSRGLLNSFLQNGMVKTTSKLETRSAHLNYDLAGWDELILQTIPAMCRIILLKMPFKR